MISIQFQWILGAGVLGLLIGSFLNVVIIRLPKMLQFHWEQDHKIHKPTYNLFFPRSHCSTCKQPIAIQHNIPVLSFIWLHGRCGYCQTSISIRYPLVEILTAFLSIAVLLQFGVNTSTLPALILVWGLIALTFIDIEHHLLPDNLTLPLLWLGLIFNLFALFQPIQSAVLGAIFGYLTLWLVYWGFKILTGQEGMGYGDFKLLALLGAWLGWEVLPIIVFISSLCGSIVGSCLIFFQKKGKNTPIPFGPFLSIGGLIALFYGQTLIQFYLRVFNL